MAAKTHIFDVEMTCEGCVKAIQNVLSKLEGKGIDKIEISLPEKTVTVLATLPVEEILELIKKTGKEVKLRETH